jgi:hypothetical protein
MRLWSLHPSYLDAKGLTALWREGLLARKVLLSQTRGYRHHPQLERFKQMPDPAGALDVYLLAVYEEAGHRGYHFDRDKLGPCPSPVTLEVTDGQLRYELRHLKEKLITRAPERHEQLAALSIPRPHPIFEVVHGDVEPWERV